MRRINLDGATGASHLHARGRHALQRLGRALGLEFLHERERSVQDDHGDDRSRKRRDAGHHRKHRSDPQQQRQRVAELLGQRSQMAGPFPPADLVRAVLI